jgi:hypothetical protein
LRQVIANQEKSQRHSISVANNISMDSEISLVIRSNRFKRNLSMLIGNSSSFPPLKELQRLAPTTSEAILATLLQEKMNHRISLNEK